MRAVPLARSGETLRILCLGAHPDDIEIGAGGTILNWITSGVQLHVHWCVASASADREEEARRSAAAFLDGAASTSFEIGDFKDSYFPYQGERIKDWIGTIRSNCKPDIVLTHQREDAHQDHREIAQLTWNAFRNHLILEYEIPKWDGDFGQQNFYIPLASGILEKKIELLMKYFETQRSKDWFDPHIFRGLARLRGMECRAPDHYAEAFKVRKIVSE